MRSHFSSAQSLKQFNFSIFIVVGVIIILILVKKCAIPAKQTYGDLYIKTKDEAIQAFVRMEESLSEPELAELNSLIAKGMQMLPEYQREELKELQERYAYQGHAKFNQDDVVTMRQLNYRGISHLSEEDQARFHYLMLKATGRVSRD